MSAEPGREPSQPSSPGIRALCTIGVYGFDEAAFFAALTSAGVDTFCDLRARRGVRGSQYAFANAVRLQHALEGLGIRYRHHLELAPGAEVRRVQHAADAAERVAKRQRAGLSPAFIAAYEASRLAAFDSLAFVAALGPEARRAVLFCVERDPAACHRSLVAERLRRDLGIEVAHLAP